MPKGPPEHPHDVAVPVDTRRPDAASRRDADGTAAPPGTDDAGIEHGLRLIEEALDELGYEDAKAARLLGALFVAISALVTGFFAGNWSPTNMTPAGEIVWYLGAATVLIALGLVGAAVVTRGGRGLRAGDSNRLAFYGHAARHHDVDGLTATLRQVAQPEQRIDRVSERLWHVSRILTAKKRLLRAGVTTAGVGVVLCILAAPVNLLARAA